MRFTLVVMPGGKAILTTPERISSDQARVIREVWRAWQEDNGVLVFGECDVRLVEDVDLEIADG